MFEERLDPFPGQVAVECTNLFEGILVLRHGTIVQYHAAVVKTGANSKRERSNGRLQQSRRRGLRTCARQACSCTRSNRARRGALLNRKALYSMIQIGAGDISAPNNGGTLDGPW
jgi:hypothetical protein